MVGGEKSAPLSPPTPRAYVTEIKPIKSHDTAVSMVMLMAIWTKAAFEAVVYELAVS